MVKQYLILTILLFAHTNLHSQSFEDSINYKLLYEYKAAIEFSDAAINSLSALNSLLKKENYRNKIASFNNPTSNDIGFNLQLEINTALKPLLEKSRNVNSNKFMDVVGSLVTQTNNSVTKSFIPATSIFSTVTSLVSNLTITEKRVTKNDLDSFVINVSRYFGQYEKLNRINQQFDLNIQKIDFRLLELQTDMKDYLLDLIIAYNSTFQRSSLKQKTPEDLMLQYLDKAEIEKVIQSRKLNKEIYFPADAIKTAKDIASSIQKIYSEYQKVYTSNYQDIKNLLIETKALGNNINKQTIDKSLNELQTLYAESKSADAFNLRLNTLNERLKNLVATEKLR